MTIKQLLLIVLIWFLSYIIPFIIKWIINYIYFGKDNILDIFSRMSQEGFNIDHGIPVSSILEKNIGLVLPFYYWKESYFVLASIIIFSILNYIFYANKEKYIGFVIIICLCMARLFFVPIQAILIPYTTYRCMIPIFIILIYISLKQLSNIRVKKKK